MRSHFVVISAGAAAAALTGLASAGAAPAGASVQGSRAAPGAQLWAARYNGPANSFDYASSMAAGPGGSKVFVTGTSYGGRATGHDYATVAYDAATGGQLWAGRYSGAGNRTGYRMDRAMSVAVAPSGSRVFVTGSSVGRTTGYDYATVAYSAATGKQVWVSRYNGPLNGHDAASSVAVSPGGRMVFVTGSSGSRTGGGGYATVAYSAATGRQLWVSRYNGPADAGSDASSIVVSPGGRTVFVTGTSGGRTGGGDYATVAYSAATGRQLWVSRYNGPASGVDTAHSIAVSPGGRTVFVSGTSGGRTSSGDYATVAYSAATGRRLWVSRYNGPANRLDEALSMAVNPSGGKVYVTGAARSRGAGDDYATVAYSAATGRRLWVSRYNGPASRYDVAWSVAVSPAGSTVLVTGESYGGPPTGSDYATVAYSAATGRQLWVSRYNDPGNADDTACCVTVSPAGTTVFVTGSSYGATTMSDYATVAYRG
jgi:hypothetical protein